MPGHNLAAFIYSCWYCGHFNYGRRFCEKCGTKLDGKDTGRPE